MIKVYRSKKSLPKNLDLQFQLLKKKATYFYNKPKSQRNQMKFGFNYKALTDAKDILAYEFNFKCVYCESHIEPKRGTHDAFRPRTNAKGIGPGDFSEEHYWWLAYEWNNIYYSCQECNRFKQSFFPVEGPRCKVGAPYTEVLKEYNLIIDACSEDPELMFDYDENGRIIPLNRKAEVTIDILKLNRITLVEARKKALQRFTKETAKKKNYSELINDIVHRHDCQRQFLGILRWYLRKRKLIATNITRKAISQTIQQTIGSSVIERIQIKNFKGIGKIDLRLSIINDNPDSLDHGETWLVVLGENGVGKTSLLQAIALALSDQSYIDSLGISPKDILKYGSKEGHVRVYIQGIREPLKLSFSENSRKIILNSESIQTFILGYGSTRLGQTGGLNVETITGRVHAKNLFSPEIALIEPVKWLYQLHTEAKLSKDKAKLFNWVALAIKDLLLLTGHEKLEVLNGNVVIKYPGRRSSVPLGDLSDGYKSILTLTIDMISTLLRSNRTMDAANGIVIIDEIGTHLHPRWRMRVVKSLRRVFPNLQFIVTTHDPLCLRGVRSGEVVVLDKNKQGNVRQKRNLPDPSGFRVDQLLASEFFGLSSTIDPDIEELFNEYYFLLGLPRPNEKQLNRINELKAKLSSHHHLGNNIREDIYFATIDKLLAEDIHKGLNKSRIKLEEETIELIKREWGK